MKMRSSHHCFEARLFQPSSSLCALYGNRSTCTGNILSVKLDFIKIAGPRIETDKKKFDFDEEKPVDIRKLHW